MRLLHDKRHQNKVLFTISYPSRFQFTKNNWTARNVLFIIYTFFMLLLPVKIGLGWGFYLWIFLFNSFAGFILHVLIFLQILFMNPFCFLILFAVHVLMQLASIVIFLVLVLTPDASNYAFISPLVAGLETMLLIFAFCFAI